MCDAELVDDEPTSRDCSRVSAVAPLVQAARLGCRRRARSAPLPPPPTTLELRLRGVARRQMFAFEQRHAADGEAELPRPDDDGVGAHARTVLGVP